MLALLRQCPESPPDSSWCGRGASRKERLTLTRALLAALLAMGLINIAGAVVISVPGTSNPWLAGMPAGATASILDVAPAQSPAQVTGLAFAPGDALRFSAVGSTDHCSPGSCGLAGAEGDLGEGSYAHAAGPENGIGNVTALIDSLIGVFLDGNVPSGVAPSGLDFSTALSRDFATLSPLLKQPFYIGDGFRNDGVTVQSFLVPAGATRLFLGTMDGYDWWNNVGSLTVTVALVPEPGSVALLGLAFAALGFSRRRKLH